MVNSATPVVEVDGSEHAAQLVVEQPDQLDPGRDLGPPGERVGDESEQPAGGHRRQAEDDDLRKSVRLRKSDRVRIAADRRVGVRARCDRFDRPTGGLDHPVDLLLMRNREVGQLAHRVSLACCAARRQWPLPSTAMYRFLVRPKWLAFTLLCAAAVVAMANLAVWQLGRLDERRQFNSLVEQRTAAPPVPIEELLGADPDDTAWRSVTATGTLRGSDRADLDRRRLSARHRFSTLGRSAGPRRSRVRRLGRAERPSGTDGGGRARRPDRQGAEEREVGRRRRDLPRSRHQHTAGTGGHPSRPADAHRGVAPVLRDPVVGLRRLRGGRLDPRRPPLGSPVRRAVGRSIGASAVEAPGGSVAGGRPGPGARPEVRDPTR